MLRKEITVFKLGGSLLDLPDLKSRLSEAIDLCNSIYPVLVVGGGPLADLVYDYQSIHKYDDQTGHRLAIQALEFNSYLVESFFTPGQVAHDYRTCKELWVKGHIPILNPFTFLKSQERANENPIPATWSFTTDSISARISEMLQAGELVLLKSVRWDSGSSLASAAQNGDIDPFFEKSLKSVPRLTWINMRDHPLIRTCIRPI
jgi:aspartokinase-like uncharacterized kinase